PGGAAEAAAADQGDRRSEARPPGLRAAAVLPAGHTQGAARLRPRRAGRRSGDGPGGRQRVVPRAPDQAGGHEEVTHVRPRRSEFRAASSAALRAIIGKSRPCAYAPVRNLALPMDDALAAAPGAANVVYSA